MQKALIFLGIGTEIGVLILASYELSKQLENKYPTGGMIFIGLSAASLIGWLIQVIWLLKRLEKQEDSDNKNEAR